MGTERRPLSHVLKESTGTLDEPRPGTPRRITDGQIEDVVVRTLETTPRGATHWSTRDMAKASGLSHMTVQRIWQAFGLQPHRSETFKLSPDPLLIDKVRDIVGLYVKCERRRKVADSGAGPDCQCGPARQNAGRESAPWHDLAVRGSRRQGGDGARLHAPAASLSSFGSAWRPLTRMSRPTWRPGPRQLRDAQEIGGWRTAPSNFFANHCYRTLGTARESMKLRL